MLERCAIDQLEAVEPHVMKIQYIALSFAGLRLTLRGCWSTIATLGNGCYSYFLIMGVEIHAAA